MKTTACLLALSLFFFACKKGSDDPQPTPPPVDNGPIGGTYSFSGAVDKYYDTIPGSGINTINEYTTTTSNIKGTITITATNISSKGLMYDYAQTGTKKEVNTSNGAEVVTNYAPTNGSRGAVNSSYNSNYTISTTAGELTIDDGQYLFNPAFVLQPVNKKYSYSLSGTTLKITSSYYNAGTKTRSVSEASFVKQ